MAALIEFLRQAPPRELRLIALLTAIAGLTNALLIVIINQVAELSANDKRPGWLELTVFASAFVAYYACERGAVLRANVLIEALLRRLRLGVIDALRCSDLRTVERTGQGRLIAVLSQETNQLSVTFPLMIESFQQAVLLVAALTYLAYLSLPTLGVFLLTAAAGAISYAAMHRGFRRRLQEVSQRQSQLLEAMGGIIHGAKELRLHAARDRAVHGAFGELSAATEALLVQSGDRAALLAVVASLVVFSMLGVVAFVLPNYVDTHGGIIFQLIPTLLFCTTPIVRIIAQAPMYLQAAMGLETISVLQRQLEASGRVPPERAREIGAGLQDFRQLRYVGLTFHHRDAAGETVFTAGPLDLDIERGQTIFVVGGNGSGKSTVMRLITGLYRAQSGRILVDDRPIEGDELAGLHELFCAVFADFHLFDRLYGLEDVDPQRVQALLVEMGLHERVTFRDGRFSEPGLSTGQRKRLALVVALLEDRPVYVFDEWCAEQDVQFRHRFYTEILPSLKARGKTVIVVSHDDRYQAVADRVICLELGRVLWERPASLPEP